MTHWDDAPDWCTGLTLVKARWIAWKESLYPAEKDEKQT